MSEQLRDSMDMLERDWEVDPRLREFVLGGAPASDEQISVGPTTFHIPRISGSGLYVLWKCHWPDCHNCCERQGRLPLTSADLIRIGGAMGYARASDFAREQTNVATHAEPSPSGGSTVMTTINLKRSEAETEAQDGTRIPCRFLDGCGSCTLHPARPGACAAYPFSPWLVLEGGRARAHAAYQFTGDCPGFYLAESVEPMREILGEYSQVLYGYALASARTERERASCVSSF